MISSSMDLQLEGSPAVVAANDKFTATMTNDVRWRPGPAPDLLELGSDTSIQVQCSFVPLLLLFEQKIRSNGSLQCCAALPTVVKCQQVALEVPSWFKMVPVSAIERTGCSVMQRVLDRMVPRFLKQLQADYDLWAAGDGSRKAIGTGQL